MDSDVQERYWQMCMPLHSTKKFTSVFFSFNSFCGSSMAGFQQITERSRQEDQNAYFSNIVMSIDLQQNL
jgi:hypothetical protein